MASPRILVIGAGSRGNAYAKAITSHPSGHIVAIVEPVAEKRRRFSNRYGVTPELCFESWEDLISDPDKVRAAVDAVCICTLDESHAEVAPPPPTHPPHPWAG